MFKPTVCSFLWTSWSNVHVHCSLNEEETRDERGERERERELTDDRGQRLQGKRKQTSRKSFSVSLSLFFFFSCEFWCSVSLRAPPAGRGQTVMRLWWTFKTLCALNGYFLILHKVQLSGSVYKGERMKREYSRVCVLCTFVYTRVCVCVPEGISWRCAPVPRSVK